MITRTILLDRVEHGVLSREAAEEIARKSRTIGRLAHEPPTNQFDPMQEAYWTLAMTLAWAIWRDPEKVREFWNEWRLRKYVWEPNRDENGGPAPGFQLLRLEAVSLHDVVRAGAAIPGIEASGERRRLWRYLEENKLQASATDPATGAPVAIPHSRWPHIGPINYYDGDEESVSGLDGLTPLYRSVMVERVSALAFWPSTEELQKEKENAPADENDKPLGILSPTTAASNPGEKQLPALQAKVRQYVMALWPDGILPARVQERDKAIRDKWAGTPPHPKTIYRAMRNWTGLDK